jgi:hypothetical protein
MYKIFATNPSDSAELSFDCDDVQVALRLCVDLFLEGYCVHSVGLPNGSTISRKRIEEVIRSGLRKRPHLVIQQNDEPAPE